MAVGADVLDGGSAGETGDFAHGFDAGEAMFAGIGDNVIPVFAAHDFDDAWILLGDTAHAVDNNDTIVTFVVTDSVGAVAHDEGGELVLSGEAVGVRYFFGVFDFNNVAGWATEAHCGKT